jgi:hypothetical protein
VEGHPWSLRQILGWASWLDGHVDQDAVWLGDVSFKFLDTVVSQSTTEALLAGSDLKKINKALQILHKMESRCKVVFLRPIC